MSNQLIDELNQKSFEIGNDIINKCPLAQELMVTYELWKKNNNKETTLKLKMSFDKWKKKHGQRN